MSIKNLGCSPPIDCQKQFEEAFDDFTNAQYASDEEDRIQRYKDSARCFSELTSSNHNYTSAAMYFHALSKLEIAEYKSKSTSWEKVRNLMSKFGPLHPCHVDAQYWQGYCWTKVFPANFEKAITFFSKVGREHPFYEDAQFWQGYSNIEISKGLNNPNDKMDKLLDAQVHWGCVSVRSPYFTRVQELSRQCEQQLNSLCSS